MRVLFVVGSCLMKNTSANMSHNAFLQGFIENGCDVDVIMADESWGESDQVLTRFDSANYYLYTSQSFVDRVKAKFSHANQVNKPANNSEEALDDANHPNEAKSLSLRDYAKALFYYLFKPDPFYPLQKKWLKKAKKFESDKTYDLVVSNSCPEAAHKLVSILIKQNSIKYKRWIQIWEDPWYYDVYGGMSEDIKEEEHRLLMEAEEIYYVSPLTLIYQKRYYSDCAEKMKCLPLPFLDFSNAEKDIITIPNSFGYFGDYYSVTRNLRPFYEALVQSGYIGQIYGDSDLSLNDTEQIKISGRVTLDILSKIQDKTEVLVHLSNLKGGQIPGKIYHYSATTKPILFILDGTNEEKKALRDFFGRFDRYYFCDNTIESVLDTMKKICSEKKTFKPVDQFNPKNVIQKIIDTK